MSKSVAHREPRRGQVAKAGRTVDGIVILKPAVPPKHFTQVQIERTVGQVRSGVKRERVEPEEALSTSAAPAE